MDEQEMLQRVRNIRDRALLKRIIDSGEGMTRPELVDVTGLPRTSVYDSLERLEELGLLFRFSIQTGKRGRPPICWMTDDQVKA